ncbi:hypothetical protein niasHT_035903 [Heterodera trifolii]|uniref:Uncharacterized protein n=1 Tax=Heterodera trifolii TaxID=157864 RepID=A0ABD2I9M1_9BILA
MELPDRFFHRLRQFVPSILNDCPSLRVVSFGFGKSFIEFPADDSATASDGQAIGKWLFTPLQNNMPKMLKTSLSVGCDENTASIIEAFKSAFANASSPANFIVHVPISWRWLCSDTVFPLINELTREQLALKRTKYDDSLLLVRCPIARDESKWAKWEEEAIGCGIDSQWNRIDIQIYDEANIGDGLLDATLGPMIIGRSE